MRFRFLAITAIVFIVISACQLPGVLLKSGSKSNNSKEVAYVFAANADPINVSVELDNDRSVEQVIPVEGGTLSTKGADGTTYTLDIPADALLNETSIRMTPVASLTGLPFGSGEPLAVQFEPEGLFLNNFATLTITPAQEIPIDQQIFFGYQGSGQDVIIAPPVVDSREIKILLMHFSGNGVTKGFLADLEPVRNRIGGDAERRLQSIAAEKLGRERQNQLLGSGDDSSGLGDLFNDLFSQYEKEVVKVRIAAAGTSCAAGRLALETLLGFERQKQLLGSGSDGAMDNVIKLMDTVGPICVKEEYQLCVDDHIIHRMIPVWLGMKHQFAVLSGGEGAEPAYIQLAKELAQKCLTFELKFESTSVFDADGGGYESIVNSKVKLRFNPDALKIQGEAPLVNTAFTFKADGCTVTSNRGGGTFTAAGLAYITDKKTPKDELGYVRDFKFAYFPGRTSESFTIKCPDQPSFTPPPSSYWFGVYLVLHADELTQGTDNTPGGNGVPPGTDITGMLDSTGLPSIDIPPGVNLVMEDWEIFGNEYYAKKEWIKEDAGLGITEVGTFKLYHRPGQ